MIMYFADTSALLGQTVNLDTDVLISPITVQELENIKTSNSHSEEIKARARAATRAILHNGNIHIVSVDNKKIDNNLKHYSFLQNINDHRILLAAELYAKEQNQKITFVTNDALQYIFASQLPHLIAIKPSENIDKVELWSGWGKYYPNESEMAMLYSDPKINILKCQTNEFAEIYVGSELKDILVWTGEEYRNIKYKEFVAPTGERIRPRNLEQKMYLDLLQNDEVPIKLCIGHFGTGKSMFAETWATNQLMQGKYDKIVFVKNNLDVKGAGKLGTLPGDEIDKQYPWLRQIEDHLGPQLFDQYLTDGKIEPAHLSTLRGRDLKHSLILVDEAENLLISNIQLLLGRVAEGSQIIFCADIRQCDYKDEKMSGIPRLIERLAGNPLFGMVKLMKTERSKVAACADLLD